MNACVVELHNPVDIEEWRHQARTLLRTGMPPERVHWTTTGQKSLFPDREDVPATAVVPVPEPRVPRAFLRLAENVLAHRDRQRHALLYRLLWRLAHGERHLLDVEGDLDVVRVRSWERAVEHEIHRMQAFIRFRLVQQDGADPVYVAWFEPQHPVLERAAPHFARRFPGMRWAILTPERSAHWNGQAVIYGPGADRAQSPNSDDLEELWRTYYASVFNPARLNRKALQAHMPARYWKNLPEARSIHELTRQAGPATADFVARPPTVPRKRFPAPPSAIPAVALNDLDRLRDEAQACRRCPLWEPATQAVLGEGSRHARVMLVGEQPGDQEDLAGRPFVGPAGQLLNEALAEAGIARGDAYLTNAVKHFKFQPRGKRRLHQTANAREQAACLPWLEQEMKIIDPEVVVCLGAVATQALLGRGIRLMAVRGRWQTLPDGRSVLPTVHPAYLLRLSDPEEREAEYRRFVAELRLAARRQLATG